MVSGSIDVLINAIIMLNMLQVKKRFWGKKPGFDVGDVLHIGVNVIFVFVLYAMITSWDLVLLAVALVLLSKWRIFSVQPRFWLPNVRANLVDVIVGVSSIILTFQAPYSWVAVAWMLLYLGWLLFLKPQSQELWVGLQAFWAQFLGIIAVMMIPMVVRVPLIVCIVVWLVAWAAARHFFSNYEEPHYRTLGLIWSFLVVQLAWIMLHWVEYYNVFDAKISIFAIVIAIISASLASMYHSYKNDTLQKAVLIENGLFAFALLAVVLITAQWSAQL